MTKPVFPPFPSLPPSIPPSFLPSLGKRSRQWFPMPRLLSQFGSPLLRALPLKRGLGGSSNCRYATMLAAKSWTLGDWRPLVLAFSLFVCSFLAAQTDQIVGLALCQHHPAPSYTEGLHLGETIGLLLPKPSKASVQCEATVLHRAVSGCDRNTGI